MADLEALANEYLVTIDGKTADDPCGAWCGDGDVTNWVAVVRRIRKDLTRLLTENKGLKYPKKLTLDSAQWVIRATRFKSGNITHIFGAGTDEVIALVAFARRGVQLMYESQIVIEDQGGDVGTPGPKPTVEPGDDLLPGPDVAWGLVGGVLLTLFLLQLARK